MAPIPRGFKYDVIRMLSAIRDRPVIWDRTLEIYKDKIERKNAWDEICSIMDEKYAQMSWEEKRATVEHLLNKWTNIRDTFVKSVKNKMGKPKKKYLLFNYLKFLIKVIPEEEISEEYNSSEEPSDAVYMKVEELDEDAQEGTSSSFTSSRKRKRADSEEYIPKKSKREKQKRISEDSLPDSDYATNETNNIDFVEVDSNRESDPRVMNEDEAFFASLLPTVVRYNEDERLEFRMEVLAVMKSIKDKRTW